MAIRAAFRFRKAAKARERYLCQDGLVGSRPPDFLQQPKPLIRQRAQHLLEIHEREMLLAYPLAARSPAPGIDEAQAHVLGGTHLNLNSSLGHLTCLSVGRFRSRERPWRYGESLRIAGVTRLM